MRVHDSFRTVAVVLVVAMAIGCGGIGHRTLKGARSGYNEAMVRTWNEQLLRNLVRLRYRDTPLFLEISSITAQYSFSGNAGLSGSLASGDSDEIGLGTGVSYSESPTISYAPLQGERFVRQLLSPISLDSIQLLSGAGWSVERVFRTCVQEINGVLNAPNASGPTPSRAPEYRDFREVSRLFRQLQLANAYIPSRRADADGHPIERVRLDAGRVPGDVLDRLRELLGVDRQSTEFQLTQQMRRHGPGEIDLVNRSLLGVMYYLSQGVDVPESHLAAGVTNVTRGADGSLFDWGDVTGDLLRVRQGNRRPPGAFVAVSYRNHWYWIADDDLESKTTFSLLTQLFYLQAGQLQLPEPNLTLSVN